MKIIQGLAFRVNQEFRLAAWTAWHTAALTRVKRMPALESILSDKPKQTQTWEEQLTMVKALNLVFGQKEN